MLCCCSKLRLSGSPCKPKQTEGTPVTEPEICFTSDNILICKRDVNVITGMTLCLFFVYLTAAACRFNTTSEFRPQQTTQIWDNMLQSLLLPLHYTTYYMLRITAHALIHPSCIVSDTRCKEISLSVHIPLLLQIHRSNCSTLLSTRLPGSVSVKHCRAHGRAPV